jgi:hypothetical protein
MKTYKIVLTIVGFFLLASFTVFHHGWSSYDQTKEIDFKGMIEESTFENPHVLVKVKYEDEINTIFLAPSSRIIARGLAEDDIKKGIQVRLVAYPHKTEKNEMRAERIFVDGIKYELR